MEPPLSAVVEIKNYPKDPVDMFKSLLERMTNPFLTMNLATVDSAFGVLNRTVVYRGLVDNAIVFVTERNSRKYQNIMNNPKVGLTLLMLDLPTSDGIGSEIWQVRQIGCEAVELQEQEIAKFWKNDAVHAKLRSHLAECGKPIDVAELQQRHDQLLQDYVKGNNQLMQTTTYTVFKLLPQCWDFYKSQENKIADRLQYRRMENTANEWEIIHVAP